MFLMQESAATKNKHQIGKKSVFSKIVAEPKFRGVHQCSPRSRAARSLMTSRGWDRYFLIGSAMMASYRTYSAYARRSLGFRKAELGKMARSRSWQPRAFSGLRDVSAE